MNTVERVKALCKEKNIPISKLEKDLSFSNGYIGQLRKGMLPADRLEITANYLDVSVHYLLTGEENEEDFSIDNVSPEMAEVLKRVYYSEKLSSSLLKFFSLPENKQNHVLELIELLGE